MVAGMRQFQAFPAFRETDALRFVPAAGSGPIEPRGASAVGAEWTAIVLAGRRPGVDPLAARFGLANKSLIPLGGETLVARVVRTLRAVPAIGRIIVASQDVEALRDGALGPALRDPATSLQASRGSISETLLDIVGRGAARWPYLVTTADNALLQPSTLAGFLDRARGDGVSIGFVERATVEAAHPETRRTWLRFRGGAYTGANLFALHTPCVAPALRLWRGVEEDRKKGWRVLACFGPWLLARALTRTITIERGLAAAGERLGTTARPIVLDDADVAIDIDKPDDHRIAEAIIAARARQP